jgi:hypothetical protein
LGHKGFLHQPRFPEIDRPDFHHWQQQPGLITMEDATTIAQHYAATSKVG